MDCSQILPGAVDLGPCSLSTGYFLDKPFIVYALDRNVVVVDAKLRHVQTILGSDCGYGDTNITSLHSAEYSGRIAVAWGSDVVIFEPKENDEATSTLKLMLPTWSPSQTISLDYPVLSLCWDGEGTQLLTGGESIVLWCGESTTSFVVGSEAAGTQTIRWVDIWKCKLSQPVMYLRFSSDGVMFASCGKNDPLVKIWYPARSRTAPSTSLSTGFSFSYIAHPRAVTSFSWRKIGALMPRHVVPNVLLTHCKDNICRLWSHKLLKKNKRMRLRFFISASIDPITDIPFRSLNAIEGGPFFVHWLNNKETAFTTKAEKAYKTTSAPLSRRSSISSIVSEEILQSWVCLEEDGTDHVTGSVLEKKQMQATDSLAQTSPAMHVGSFFRSNSSMGDAVQDTLSKKALGQLVDTWCNSPDLLLCIHPNSGSLMVWTVEGLDGSLYTTRLVHVSFSACLPHCFPLHLASSLCHELLQVVVKDPNDVQLLQTSSDFSLPVPELRLPNLRKSETDLSPSSGGQESSLILVSKHFHGTLNIWSVELTQQTNHGNSIAGLIHCGETGGHRFEVRTMLRHPRLPLLLTISCGEGAEGLSVVGSELIVWNTELPGSLECNGNISELAKMSSASSSSFRYTAWVPPIAMESPHSSSQSPTSQPHHQSVYFVANVGSELCLYHISLFEGAGSVNKPRTSSSLLELSSINKAKVSNLGQSSGGKQPEVISYTGKKSISMVASIESDILSFEEVVALHVFHFCSLVTSCNIQKTSCSDFAASIAVVLVENRCSMSSSTGSQSKQTFLHVWRISFDSSPSAVGQADPLQGTVGLGEPKVKKMSPVLLPLPQGVYAVTCVPATDTPSSFQLQLFGVSAPFLFSTVCSDGTVRSWQFSVHQHANVNVSGSPRELGKSGEISLEVYEVVGVSKANVPPELCGTLNCNDDVVLQSYSLVSPIPCALSAANPGQFAMAHNLNHPSKSSNASNASVLKSTSNSLNKHALVSIWECKSSGGLRWSCESTLQLTGLRTLVVESQKPKVMLEWIPIENGSYLLATCFSSIISIFSQSLVGEQDLLKVIQKTRPNEVAKEKVPDVANMRKPSWVRVLQFDCCQSYPSLYASSLLYTGSNSLLVSIGNELHLYSCYAKGSDLDPLLTEGDSHFQSSRNKAYSPPPLLIGVDSSKLSQENNINLLNYAQARNSSLPQYHPTILMKLMASGKVTTVKLILVNLTKYLILYQRKSPPKDEAIEFQGFVPPEEKAEGTQRQRLLSVSADGFVRRSNKVKVTVSVDSIPPLSLSKLGLLPQGDQHSGRDEGQADDAPNDYDELFSTGAEPTLQDFSYGFEEVTKDLSFDDINPETSPFTPEMAQKVNTVLQYIQLPGLSDLEQVLLLTIAETVANTKMGIGVHSGASADVIRNDPSEDDAGDAGISSITGTGYASSGRGREAMDDCGFRYLLILQNYVTLARSLPKDVRPNALKPVEFVWAFHSDAEKELLAAIPGIQNDELTWEELRNVGAGWWVRSSDTLKRLTEKLARNQFTQKKDPLNASLFYLAMKKKSLLKGLFKSVQDQKMTDFFNNDFSQDRWRKAALKNAFALLGKQRFDQAAAFFLLAGKLWDAVEVCINQLQDLQLTWVIIRLYEGDNGPTSERFLKENVIGINTDGKPILHESEFDPLLRSMGYWLLQDYCRAQETLLQSPGGKMCLDPKIFNFYFFLRQHPLLLRRDYAGKSSKQLYQVQPPKPAAGHHHLSGVGSEPLTAVERSLLFNTAYYYLSNGCPLLCLDVLSRLPKTVGLSADEEVVTISASDADVTSIAKRSGDETMIQSGTLSDVHFGRLASVSSKSQDGDMDWSKPISSAADTDIDWSTPLSFQTNLDTKHDEGDLDWSQPVSSRLRMEDDAFELSSSDVALSPAETITPVPSVEEMKLGTANKLSSAQLSNQGLFILSLAEQLQHNACLSILTEELATLHLPTCYGYLWDKKRSEGLPLLPQAKIGQGTGVVLYQKKNQFEKILPRLRGVLLDWLRREMVAVKQLCGFGEELSEASIQKTDTNYFCCELLSTHLSYIALHSPTSPNMQYIKFELMHLLNTVLPWNMRGTQEADCDISSSPDVSSFVVDAVQLPILTCCSLPTQHPTNIASHLRLMCSSIVELLSCHVEPPLASTPFQSVAVLFELCCAISCCLTSCLSPVKLSELLTDVTVSVEHDSVEMLSKTPIVLSDNISSAVEGAPAKQGIRPRSDDSVFVVEKPNTKHSAWPGLSKWPNTLQSEEGKEPTPISLLLVECCTVAYLGLMTVAWSWHSVYDILVLLANAPNGKMWDGVFGGGWDMKKSSQSEKNRRKMPMSVIQNLDAVARRLKTLAKTKASDTSVTESGVFIPPKRNLLQQYLTKPKTNPAYPEVDFEYEEQKQPLDEWQELQAESEKQIGDHDNPDCFGWTVMNVCITKHITSAVKAVVAAAGVEILELVTASPMMYKLLKVLQSWESILYHKLEVSNGPETIFQPDNSETLSPFQNGPVVMRQKSILDPKQSPFNVDCPTANMCKQLWSYLAHQEEYREIFVRHIGSKKRMGSVADPECDQRVVYKDTEGVISFCINSANQDILALATSRSVEEISLLDTVDAPPVEEITEARPRMTKSFSIAGISDELTMMQMAAARTSMQSPVQSLVAQSAVTSVQHNLLVKRPLVGVRRMAAHPNLAYYLTGSSDGSVSMWEFGTTNPVSVQKSPQGAGVVTKIRFTPQGNKYGVTDANGKLHLWQGIHASPKASYQTLSSAMRFFADFVFLSSSSFIAACGESTDMRNVCIWDTLLPTRRSIVREYVCHDGGASALGYSPRKNRIICGGKKGEICIFDVRQHALLQSLPVHNGAINSIVVNDVDGYFVTGSSEGDIKVLDLASDAELASFTATHSKARMFRSEGGVRDMYVLPGGKLFSCGGDGCIKSRMVNN